MAFERSCGFVWEPRHTESRSIVKLRETAKRVVKTMTDTSQQTGNRGLYLVGANHDAKTTTFERQRSRLVSIAYRILGSRAEAEDVVQDTYLKWSSQRDGSVRNPDAWLTAATTRAAIDVLRSARIKRTEYVGPWLPEPVHTELYSEQEAQAELASTLSTAFLHVLETLSPKERAAFLLHEVFSYPHAIVADMIEITDAASRKLVSRARQKVSVRDVSHIPAVSTQKRMLAAFQSAIQTGDANELAAMLADDIRLVADGGGKVAAIGEPVFGGDVVPFVVGSLRRWWLEYTWTPTAINGRLGAQLHAGDELVAVLSFAYNGLNQLIEIQIMRNPDKMSLATRRLV